MYFERPNDMERAATRMMGQLAFFKAHSFFGEGEYKDKKVEDVYPSLSVWHVNLRSKIRLRELKSELETSVPGTTAHLLRLIARSNLGIIKDISQLAIDFEEHNKKAS